jgi:ribosomal protein L1
MIYSPRYQKIKAQIPSPKIYSLAESLNFLQSNNLEKSKGVKISFTLNWAKQKSTATLKSKVVLPYPLPSKGKIAVIKDDLPAEITKQLAKNQKVELLSIKDAHQRIIKEKSNQVKKKSQ